MHASQVIDDYEYEEEPHFIHRSIRGGLVSSDIKHLSNLSSANTIDDIIDITSESVHVYNETSKLEVLNEDILHSRSIQQVKTNDIIQVSHHPCIGRIKIKSINHQVKCADDTKDVELNERENTVSGDVLETGSTNRLDHTSTSNAIHTISPSKAITKVDPERYSDLARKHQIVVKESFENEPSPQTYFVNNTLFSLETLDMNNDRRSQLQRKSIEKRDQLRKILLISF
eukprot:CAMPEP_0194354072 /NCGR_PEP_ID=MMETSP0174-20130528/2265_1 /TAXON_ID=216777 /ORGANISM="Proboscia alata, Strain PI-D3" /LENGTH=228 /DNA_ID=CAMNT_0039122839 /DNA_START=435 /DNA_END=1121 /DNA_ORIENTATION=+